MQTTGLSSLLVVFVLLLMFDNAKASAGSHDAHWAYDDVYGPSHWCSIDPHSQCCGTEQSPIDIDEFEVQLELFKPLIFINYTNVPSSMLLMNNGHTIVLTLGDDSSPPGFTGGGIKDYYVFDSLHFHWGKMSSAGSEHTLGGKKYPLELHLVHYNSKYGEKSKAQINPDGLAVIAVLFQLSEKDNAAMKGIVKALDEVRYNNDSSLISEAFPLSNLLPPRTDDFFRYKGSLTTPPCSEVVTWTVLDSHVTISEDQLKRFRTLRMRTKSDDHRDADQLVDNFRPTQGLNGRRIHARSTLARMRAVHGSASRVIVTSAGLPFFLLYVVWYATWVW